MSQFCMMSTQERKIQAAAICREVKGSSDSGIDLGRKVSAPKEIMLEELSLSSNRGSRLFKQRQRRSDKYTYEKVPSESVPNLQNGTPFPGHSEVVGGTGEVNSVDSQKTPPNGPNIGSAPNPEHIAPGYGGPLMDVPPEKFNSTAIPRFYQSPWGQALMGVPGLADTINPTMEEPLQKSQGPAYKSFNRVATPFGGFDKAADLPAFKPPEVTLNPNLPLAPEVQNSVNQRPTFNRTALGWAGENGPTHLSLLIPESDDL